MGGWQCDGSDLHDGGSSVGKVKDGMGDYTTAAATDLVVAAVWLGFAQMQGWKLGFVLEFLYFFFTEILYANGWHNAYAYKNPVFHVVAFPD